MTNLLDNGNTSSCPWRHFDIVLLGRLRTHHCHQYQPRQHHTWCTLHCLSLNFHRHRTSYKLFAEHCQCNYSCHNICTLFDSLDCCKSQERMANSTLDLQRFEQTQLDTVDILLRKQRLHCFRTFLLSTPNICQQNQQHQWTHIFLRCNSSNLFPA